MAPKAVAIMHLEVVDQPTETESLGLARKMEAGNVSPFLDTKSIDAFHEIKALRKKKSMNERIRTE